MTFSSLRAIGGGYDTKEAFGELNIPIFAVQGSPNNFEIGTAVRWADYSGSGKIRAWKLGINWQIKDASVARDAVARRPGRDAARTLRPDPWRCHRQQSCELDAGGQPTSMSTAALGRQPRSQPEKPTR